MQQWWRLEQSRFVPRELVESFPYVKHEHHGSAVDLVDQQVALALCERLRLQRPRS
jgi:hypothetical protein